MKIIADTRTLEGTQKSSAAPMPAASLYAPHRVHQQEPEHRAGAHQRDGARAASGCRTASPQQILATVPEEYLLGDRALYSFAFNNVKTALSPDG